MTRRDWLDGFLGWNSSLSVRKSEATSMVRIKGFTRVEVSKFFNNIEELMYRHKCFPSQVYNMDETRMGTVQEPVNIIAPKRQRRIGSITSLERGKKINVICSMNADDSLAPRLFVFPRKRMSPTLEKDGPPGAMYVHML
ncbi:hypothetical protein PR048_009280 [Dryococelus australis]|uniref:Transposase n=1 Tax=Dryococelus australis TaxID=614101 RepID=A0ABQ9HZU0_9NEOP|nr:hypothetical protein PR048_009280 [Dryococelus australis]